MDLLFVPSLSFLLTKQDNKLNINKAEKKTMRTFTETFNCNEFCSSSDRVFSSLNNTLNNITMFDIVDDHDNIVRNIVENHVRIYQ